MLGTHLLRRSIVIAIGVALLLPTVGFAQDETPDQKPLIYSGGDASNPGFLAFLQIRDVWGLTSSCTGTLITPEWILTAAHCLQDATTVDVSVGGDDWRDGHERTGAEWQIHPSYWPAAPFGSAVSIDLGLVRLDAPIVGEELARPNLRSELPGYLQYLLVSGWGRVDPYGPAPYSLQAGWTEATSGPDGSYDGDTCLRPSSPTDYFCFGGLSGVTACPGDSGGPLYSWHDPIDRSSNFDTVYGVVSYGDADACRPYSLDSGAVNVAPHVPWIMSVTESHFGFSDVAYDSPFKSDIQWLAEEGITKGCNPPHNTKFCPKDPITREQFAAFWTRALELTDDDGITFEDVPSSNIFRIDISRLATAGITRSCNPPLDSRFCPSGLVTREQFAAFAVRGLGLTANDQPVFDDVTADNIFITDIQRLATAGITKGCNPPYNTKFCPKDPMTREQFAAFARRALEDLTP